MCERPEKGLLYKSTARKPPEDKISLKNEEKEAICSTICPHIPDILSPRFSLWDHCNNSRKNGWLWKKTEPEAPLAQGLVSNGNCHEKGCFSPEKGVIHSALTFVQTFFWTQREDVPAVVDNEFLLSLAQFFALQGYYFIEIHYKYRWYYRYEIICKQGKSHVCSSIHIFDFFFFHFSIIWLMNLLSFIFVDFSGARNIINLSEYMNWKYVNAHPLTSLDSYIWMESQMAGNLVWVSSIREISFRFFLGPKRMFGHALLYTCMCWVHWTPAYGFQTIVDTSTERGFRVPWTPGYLWLLFLKKKNSWNSKHENFRHF